MSTTGSKDWLKGVTEANAEWIRILTAYVPDMKLEVYSPHTVGAFLKQKFAATQVPKEARRGQ